MYMCVLRLIPSCCKVYIEWVSTEYKQGKEKRDKGNGPLSLSPLPLYIYMYIQQQEKEEQKAETEKGPNSGHSLTPPPRAIDDLDTKQKKDDFLLYLTLFLSVSLVLPLTRCENTGTCLFAFVLDETERRKKT